MSKLNQAISDTINNQHDVSDFINVAAGSTAPGVPEKENQLEQAAPTAQDKKRGRGRPKGTFKNKQSAHQQSFIPKELNKTPLENNIQADINLNPEKIALQRQSAARGATVLIQTTGMLVAGEDGKMGGDEFSSVNESFDKYFELKGIHDFPPGISLGLALGGYYIRILTLEKTRPKVNLFLAWIKNKYYSFRRQKLPPAPPTLSETEKGGA